MDNLSRVRQQIAAAALRAGRDPAQVKLVAVTKGVPVEIIRQVLIPGVDGLGENRAQELLSKYEELPLMWSGILSVTCRRIRSKKIIGKVSLIHSLNRWSLAQRN